MTEVKDTLFGLMAEFSEPESLIRSLRKCADEGYERLDAYSPYELEELGTILKCDYRALPRLAFLGGMAGLGGGFALQYFATAVWYPQVISGKPFVSLPAYVPICFEMAVLGAGLTAFFGLMWILRFPEPYHPVFQIESFAKASQDRYFLTIEAIDPKFDYRRTTEFLTTCAPEAIHDIPQ